MSHLDNLFEKKCRVCLQEQKILKSISEKDKTCESLTLSEMISCCTGIEVSNAGQPSKVCKNCIKDLLTAYKFRRKCLESHEFILQLYLKDSLDDMVTNVASVPKEETILKVDNTETVAEDKEMLPIFKKEPELDLPKTELNDYYPSDIEDTDTTANSMPLPVPPTLLPERSKDKYERVYKRFNEWCEENNMNITANESILLTYFEHLSKRYKSTSLWSYYSMLRSMFSLQQNVDISKYNQLISFLKQKAEGYKPKKSKVLLKREIIQFLQEADDYSYLLIKAALIIGIAGACRKDELINLLLENVKDDGSHFHIVLPKTQTRLCRKFCVSSGGIENINMVEIVRKYISLRPTTDHRRFFIGYRQGKCYKQPVGINNFAKMPEMIASFLKLPSPKEYTGHCFRRSSMLVLANSEANILTGKYSHSCQSNMDVDEYSNTSSEKEEKYKSSTSRTAILGK